MLNLYSLETKNDQNKFPLSDQEKFSLLYHSLFDYPLSLGELIKWLPSEGKISGATSVQIAAQNGYYYLKERDGLVYKRLLRKRVSAKKMEIAKKAATVLKLIPGIKMVAVTGSLAMENSTDDSDIDLMLITKKGRLWTTRLLSYFVLKVMNYSLRKPFDKYQKDKLCLNMWLDESDLVWPKKDRNLYTAHECAQIVSLVNKDNIYSKFLSANSWLIKYWPNAVKIDGLKFKTGKVKVSADIIEKAAYLMQLKYMQNKITRETITPTRAIFHPQNWGKVVMSRLSS